MTASEEELIRLWFDVERRYKTIIESEGWIAIGLWFDVERRYKTIICSGSDSALCCGLM